MAGQHSAVIHKTAAGVSGGWVAATLNPAPRTGWGGRVPSVDGGIPKLVVADDPAGLVALGVTVHETYADAMGGWDEVQWFAETVRTSLEAVARDRAARGW